MPSSIRSGLVSVTFRKLSVPEVIRVAADNGLKAIEWGGDVHVPPGDVAVAQSVRQQTEAAGLIVAAYGSYYRAAHSLPTEFDAVLASAVTLGAPTIRIWAGKTGSAAADAAHTAAVTADVARVCDLAATRNLTITLEYHGGTLTDTLPTTLTLLKAVNRPNLLSGWQPRDGMTPEAASDELQQLRPWLGNIHVFQWWPTGRTRLPLADGTDRWAAFLHAAAEDRRNRFALLEFVTNDDPTNLPADARTLNGLLAQQ